MELFALSTEKGYTYADYLLWDVKEKVELLWGQIYPMSPALATRHQLLSRDIFGQLWQYLKKKPCKVFAAPFDVRLSTTSLNDEDIFTVVQPDICVICDVSKIDARGCLGAPDIVVELLSPSNNLVDLKYKFGIYEAAGVQEYWVVSPQDNTFIQNTLANGAYVRSRPYVAGSIITTPLLQGFELDLGELFGL
jgi:Uma2 family endonuclease